MKTKHFKLTLMALILFGATSNLEADVFQATAQEVAVLPEDGSGITKVAFLFDISKLRAGENRKIEEAVLDWRLGGLSSERISDFAAYRIKSTWTKSTVLSGSIPTIEESVVADWQVNLEAPTTEEGRLVRLDLTKIVSNWTTGSEANYGIVIATRALSNTAVSSQLGKGVLTIRYGFRRF